MSYNIITLLGASGRTHVQLPIPCSIIHFRILETSTNPYPSAQKVSLTSQPWVFQPYRARCLIESGLVDLQARCLNQVSLTYRLVAWGRLIAWQQKGLGPISSWFQDADIDSTLSRVLGPHSHGFFQPYQAHCLTAEGIGTTAQHPRLWMLTWTVSRFDPRLSFPLTAGSKQGTGLVHIYILDCHDPSSDRGQNEDWDLSGQLTSQENIYLTT